MQNISMVHFGYRRYYPGAKISVKEMLCISEIPIELNEEKNIAEKSILQKNLNEKRKLRKIFVQIKTESFLVCG